jgi:cytochrome oxidase Cu insertion factor (SCO1/SenC/PrrC family)
MAHSANFYVIDREGKFAGSLPPGTKADRLADVVRERLG